MNEDSIDIPWGAYDGSCINLDQSDGDLYTTLKIRDLDDYTILLQNDAFDRKLIQIPVDVEEVEMQLWRHLPQPVPSYLTRTLVPVGDAVLKKLAARDPNANDSISENPNLAKIKNLVANVSSISLCVNSWNTTFIDILNQFSVTTLWLHSNLSEDVFEWDDHKTRSDIRLLILEAFKFLSEGHSYEDEETCVRDFMDSTEFNKLALKNALYNVKKAAVRVLKAEMESGNVTAATYPFKVAARAIDLTRFLSVALGDSEASDVLTTIFSLLKMRAFFNVSSILEGSEFANTFVSLVSNALGFSLNRRDTSGFVAPEFTFSTANSSVFNWRGKII